jgi:hypothetical protein
MMVNFAKLLLLIGLLLSSGCTDPDEALVPADDAHIQLRPVEMSTAEAFQAAGALRTFELSIGESMYTIPNLIIRRFGEAGGHGIAASIQIESPDDMPGITLRLPVTVGGWDALKGQALTITDQSTWLLSVKKGTIVHPVRVTLTIQRVDEDEVSGVIDGTVTWKAPGMAEAEERVITGRFLAFRAGARVLVESSERLFRDLREKKGETTQFGRSLHVHCARDLQYSDRRYGRRPGHGQSTSAQSSRRPGS